MLTSIRVYNNSNKNKSKYFHNSTEPSDEDPEQNPLLRTEENTEQKSIDNNNLITIEPKHNMEKIHILNNSNLKSKPVYIYDSLLKDKNIILKDHKSISGIYLLHNLINNKQYVGSAYDLSKRLASYYFPSRLIDNRYISNSILKYGHDNFTLVILEVLGQKGLQSKSNLLIKEQYYIDLYKPVLNLNPLAESSLGFKHSDQSKKLIAEFRKGKPLSEKTKLKLSILFSGELNPFWSKSHSLASLDKMRESKLGELNPMYKKPKSKEFLEHMYKDKSGVNNPMYGKAKNPETLEKLSKKVYVYNGNTKEFIKCYDSMANAVKDLRIANETIRKYLDKNVIYKEKLFYSKLQELF